MKDFFIRLTLSISLKLGTSHLRQQTKTDESTIRQFLDKAGKSTN
jgi:hypothetical protein